MADDLTYRLCVIVVALAPVVLTAAVVFMK
jgi:hypothetical protein